MKPGQYDIDDLVQGKTWRRRFKFVDAAGEPLTPSGYEFRCMFKKNTDGPAILFLSSNSGLSGVTAGTAIVAAGDDADAIDVSISDEVMETILHTQWDEVPVGNTGRFKYQGVWEIEAEDALSPNDTLPLLQGKVTFIREVVR